MVHVAVEAAPGRGWSEHYQSGGILGGRLPLYRADIGSTPHSNLAIRPRLPHNPLQRVETILALIVIGEPGALAFVTPSGVLHDYDVAFLGVALRGRLDPILVIRRAHQQNR